MNDGPKTHVIYEYGYIDNPNKQYQAYQLLIRNKKYMNAVKRLRKKYSVGEYPIDSDNPQIEERHGPADPAVRKAFYKDLKRVADRINFPGSWLEAVKDHVLGLEPEDVLLAFEDKSIIALQEKDYLELRIYGDVTVPELRKSLNKIRGLVELHNKANKTHSNIRYKSRLAKNLAIYDLAERKVPYQKIADYCSEHKLQQNMQQADVSKYIELARKQIADTYA